MTGAWVFLILIYRVFAIVFFMTPLSLLADMADTHRICDGLEVIGPYEDLKMSAAEKTLVCLGYGDKPYQQVPVHQRLYFLGNFLKARGYFYFETKNRDQSIVLKLGERSLVRRIVIKNDPLGINPRRFWKIWGRPLTTQALDDLEQWIKFQLADQGYPCIALDMKASATDGTVMIELGEARKHTFGAMTGDPIEGVNREVYKRYLAYNYGDSYRESLLELTTRRMMDSQLVINASHHYNCQPDVGSSPLEIAYLPGRPRLISLGLGFDTEEYFLFDVTWKNARFGEFASNILARIKSSYRHQQILSTYHWYYAPVVSRHALRGEASIDRYFESQYESIDLNTKIGPYWQMDQNSYSLQLWLYLQYQYSEILRGQGPKRLRRFPMVFSLNLMTHDYEFHLDNPQSGSLFSFVLENSTAEMGADLSETNISLSVTHLHNFFDFDPAIWILGIRSKLDIIDLHKNESLAMDYPSSRKLRLGGSKSLRGFARKSVPMIGAFTSFYLGLEIRVAEVIPYNLQPILFIDYGRFGERSYSLNQTRFWSPGIGVHWNSLVGTFRGSVAYGYTTGDKKENYRPSQPLFFYLSYGEYF